MVIQKNIIRIMVIVGLILLLPLFGNIFIEGWRWGFADFVILGTLLFFTGLAMDFSVRKLNKTLYRVVAIIAIALALVLVWAELAVDAVSQLIKGY